jgi:penicillin-insensitive murein endopeptidase
MLPSGQNLGRIRWRAVVTRSLCLCGMLTLLACLGWRDASAQETAAEEAQRRAMVIAQLPADAARVLFGRESIPALGPPQAIGSYDRGCLSGAIALPADGPYWQVMRPSAPGATRP